MASIDRAASLAALIRTQLAAQREPQRHLAAGALNPGKPAQDPAIKGPAPIAAQAQTAIDRHSWIVQQVRNLSPDAPGNKRRAFRIFLEAVLGEEFGRELIGTSSFNQLLGQVLLQMENDAELALAIDEAGTRLLVEAGIVKAVD